MQNKFYYIAGCSWRYLPIYWNRFKELSSRTIRPFKKNFSIFVFEKLFYSGFVPILRGIKNA